MSSFSHVKFFRLYARRKAPFVYRQRSWTYICKGLDARLYSDSYGISHGIIRDWRSGVLWPCFTGSYWCFLASVTHFQTFWSRWRWTWNICEWTFCPRTKDVWVWGYGGQSCHFDETTQDEGRYTYERTWSVFVHRSSAWWTSTLPTFSIRF